MVTAVFGTNENRGRASLPGEISVVMGFLSATNSKCRVPMREKPVAMGIWRKNEYILQEGYNGQEIY